MYVKYNITLFNYILLLICLKYSIALFNCTIHTETVINSPRFPPVGRTSAAIGASNSNNRMKSSSLIDPNYEESPLVAVVQAAKPLLPPLGHSGGKSRLNLTGPNYIPEMLVNIILF